ncbi:hypothetical protein CP981_11430 [Streptomyces platensis]|uniref:Uncharacterized protein n=1 Tax=Streptomyces platensis TaxID=58346 RepID=A0AAE6NHE7_STRPT|nr:DUF6243 family protein [Streptomyces platensis]OSY36068.1 hypothetical protein BG653_06951 [Streptomyces platensis]QEV52196.1 hypothetical protein CP981_11430 [Streptomyces platensis]
MSKGNAGGMLGGWGSPRAVQAWGRTRNKLSRGALRGGGDTGRGGRGQDGQDRRGELLRKFQERARKG